ncbi:patatin-like phospholipase family protein [Rhizobium sp. SSA_523]|uniref:patatin-like phospholipase family protein n=1 Tax=Rhizobium sp. SSA_523 TaxID=2952477 RepID=UPI002090CB16|nr:patatin-like phospholipase family protein [Rhizobium sp. SSA_523]MCO5733191.1 patatin-like phospholipase family protein [Rhizobium sp. SSA_523]WKC24061.1 patatin-like phospholipase family protein [Rhizobium sp. SSA_523]
MNTRLSLPDPRDASERPAGSAPRVALALGGGGARGIAHIAIIEALDEMGIRPVAIAGSSIGAIFGAGMAAGMTGAEMRAFSIETLGNRAAVLNRLWSLGPGSMRDTVGGFRLGHFNLERILTAFLPQQVPQTFEDLQIPLKIAVTDYYGQSEAILEEGELRLAIAASAAIPGLFMPVRINGRIMVDGGIFNPIPYEHVADGADIVIGVDVVGGPEGDGTHPPNRIESMFGASQLMMQACIALKLKLHSPQLFLRPPVSRFGVMDFLKVREILAETEGVKEELKRSLGSLL